MPDYRVELLVDGPLDAHGWEFAHGAYPKLSKKGTLVQLAVDADFGGPRDGEERGFARS